MFTYDIVISNSYAKIYWHPFRQLKCVTKYNQATFKLANYDSDMSQPLWDSVWAAAIFQWLPSSLIAVAPAELSELQLVRWCSLMFQTLLLLEPVFTFIDGPFTACTIPYSHTCYFYYSHYYLWTFSEGLIYVVRTANQGISITKDVFVNQLHSAFYNKPLRAEEKLVDLFVCFPSRNCIIQCL